MVGFLTLKNSGFLPITLLGLSPRRFNVRSLLGALGAAVQFDAGPEIPFSQPWTRGRINDAALRSYKE